MTRKQVIAIAQVDLHGLINRRTTKDLMADPKAALEHFRAIRDRVDQAIKEFHEARA